MRTIPIILTESQIKIFSSKIVKHTVSECWNWGASFNNMGYGVFGVGGKITALAHRIAWTLHNGEIPNGLFVLHKCDNPACCNPDHLFLGTQKQNLADCASKGRTTRGERNPMAKLTEAKVMEAIRLSDLGISQREIGVGLGVSRSQIGMIVHGQRWNHITNRKKVNYD